MSEERVPERLRPERSKEVTRRPVWSQVMPAQEQSGVVEFHAERNDLGSSVMEDFMERRASYSDTVRAVVVGA